MTERDKVIYSIERCICHVPDACKDCSKYGGDNAIRCMEELLTDALSLLKAQEPVTPIEREGFYYCGKCKYAFTVHRQKYCSYCGQAVKWDGA